MVPPILNRGPCLWDSRGCRPFARRLNLAHNIKSPRPIATLHRFAHIVAVSARTPDPDRTRAPLVRAVLRISRGAFLGIVPAIDCEHYESLRLTLCATSGGIRSVT